MNAGIKEMTGDWLKLLGADDVLYPNAVEELVKIGNKLENKKNGLLFLIFITSIQRGKLLKSLFSLILIA